MSVEQAAERLRTYIGYDPIVRACSDYEPDEDCVKLADEYLRLFDPTPLTEAILRASGIPSDSDDDIGEKYIFHPKTDPIGIRFSDGCAWFCAIAGDGWHIVEPITTVGDLRRLLSALHIDREVVVPESEASNG